MQVTHEIAVKAVAGVVTHGVHKGLRSPVPIKATSVEDELVKDGNHGDRVIIGAHSTIRATTQRICHVRLVVRGVEVDTIPARGEVNLGTNSVRAIDGREPGRLWGPSSGVVQAHVRNGLLLFGFVVST